MRKHFMTSGLTTVALLAATVVPASASTKATSDPATDYFAGRISQYLNGRAFSSHKDDVRRHTTLGVKTCDGDERWADGSVGVPAVEVTGDFATGFAGNITLPYQGSYRRKHFYGVLCEYDTEEKNITGTLQISIRLAIGSAAITQYEVVSSDPSTDHDSTRMSVQSIRDTIVNQIGNNL